VALRKAAKYLKLPIPVREKSGQKTALGAFPKHKKVVALLTQTFQAYDLPHFEREV